MGLFDFPRINFQGEAVIDPATGNNSFYQPLVFYDLINACTVMPPRLYLDEKNLMTGISREAAMSAIPSGVQLKMDNHEKNYIEIFGLEEKEVFHKWATTPLGNSDIDRQFHPLYSKLKMERGPDSILG